MRLFLFIAFLVCVAEVAAQMSPTDRVKGFRAYGADESQLPVASLDGDHFTLEFDVLQESPPNLYLQFAHCDRHWIPTPNLFINDPIKLRTRFPLPYRVAPDGVEHYRYQYRFMLPTDPIFPAFVHSGNYLLELKDGKTDEVLARGRFFVVEKKLRPALRITNRALPAKTNPYNQALQVEVRFQIPEIDSSTRETYYPFDFRTVDIVRNREIERVWRIDADDVDPETSIEGYALRQTTFVKYDVPVGNEYRQIDLRDVSDYPPGSMLRARRGADVSRFQQRPRRDADGAAMYRQGDRYSDYVPYQFELLWDSPPGATVYVVGDFNGWHASEHSKMKREGNRFVLATWLRRGIHDYQYVVDNGDWVTLEGNDWRSVSNFTAFVYYRDTRYGGFDRILGVVRGKNSGAFE